jgi:hypothetical protein
MHDFIVDREKECISISMGDVTIRAKCASAENVIMRLKDIHAYILRLSMSEENYNKVWILGTRHGRQYHINNHNKRGSKVPSDVHNQRRNRTCLRRSKLSFSPPLRLLSTRPRSLTPVISRITNASITDTTATPRSSHGGRYSQQSSIHHLLLLLELYLFFFSLSLALTPTWCNTRQEFLSIISCKVDEGRIAP